ncbi:protein-glutamine gamma-glutamyltransferase 2-like [Mugil cephalus]|uniref:protein-glutamine gamma-glutamyltransferase 2-like n=1 Tax=Mugil cephalus TaxID=48193 RepID=UPI001FB684AC|nr:protein-glutamine gamma-glutamyltransferase 2-like [Mugil cephalus]
MIKNVNFHCQANNIAHRTIEISTTQLIVRRGQSFLLTLDMMQPSCSWNMLILTVETGFAPSESRGTRSEFGNPSPMYTSDVKAIWKYDIDERTPAGRGIVTLNVTPPADAPVGKYSLSVMTEKETKSLGTLVVLFNPWCSDDWVYLPDERERQEYVMNEEGLIYRGSSHSMCPMPWIFGQFEEEMVDICLKLLDVNPKHAKDPADDVSARCNPIYVSRVISAMINCNGDSGVLVGRWDGNYRDGICPSRWACSVSILQRWFQNRCRPVKYGQCWVFAAVMCTVMRFLGIPCRVVTNFQSAHDTNCNLTVDEYYSESGIQDDSIWNFHVWVEGWMKRPDLGKGGSYDGWQVLDPTPQELSEGTHCCGPAPVQAILKGDTDLKYDVPFVFAEVNADIVKWMTSADGSKRKIFSDTKTVGQNISTKAVGSYARDDITNNYKHREGTSMERMVYNRAVKRLNSKEDEDAQRGQEPMKVAIRIEEDSNVKNGKDVKLKLTLCNKDDTKKMIFIHINVQGMRYNGVPLFKIMSTTKEMTLMPGQVETMPIQIPFSAYCKAMLDCDSMKVSAMAIDCEDIYEDEMDIILQEPDISMKVLGLVHVNRPMTMVVEFENPLNETLRNCSLTVNGCGLFHSDYVGGNIGDLAPNSKLRLEITTTPYKVGPKVVVADFDCSAFRDLKGSCIVDVRP